MTGTTSVTAPPATRSSNRPSAGPRPARRRTRAREWPGAVFVAPHMIMLALFMLAPTVYAIYTSLFTSKLIGGEKFSGLANYGTVLHSAEFWGGVVRVLVFAAVQVPVTIGLAFGLAVLLESGIVPGGRIFRTLFFLPYAVPGVVAALMWSFLLLPGFGAYSKILDAIGLKDVNFFSGNLVLPTIIVIVIWEWTGYNMIVLHTSLTSIPKEVTEAALMEGASFWRIALRIKLPMVMPSIVMLAFLNGVGALQLFTEPSILATFQPQAISFGFTPTLFVYHTAVGSGLYNLGAAAAVILALIIGLISLGGLAIRRRQGEFR